MRLHLGIDDIDSRDGGCTTYAATLILAFLLEKGVEFTDYPNLIRLNPNIPWKTKGNGAVALRFRARNAEDLFDEICKIVARYSWSKQGKANSGIAMLAGERIPHELKHFSEEALEKVLSTKKALQLIGKHRMRSYGEGNRMGLVGALAAIGNTLDGDHTFELLAYRSRENWGNENRAIDAQSVAKMSADTYPFTFNNYDPEVARVLVAPRGPDPVLYGVRGESPDILIQAANLIELHESVERHAIFRTNQGTGQHLTGELDLESLKAFTSGHIVGTVSRMPTMGIGAHSYFGLKNHRGEIICAVYEPTGNFRAVAMSLIPGDTVEVGGGIRAKSSKHPPALNVEYIRVLRLAPLISLMNPVCAECGRRMKSRGREQGYKCKACGSVTRSSKKVELRLSRKLSLGLYLPPPRAHRHLTKPFQRFGMEKRGFSGGLIQNWFSVNTQLSRIGAVTIIA